MTPESPDLPIIGEPDPERFFALPADPSQWWTVGTNLLTAAQVLRQGIERGTLDPSVGRRPFEGPLLLMIGLAVENLVKALIIKQMLMRNESVTNGEVLALRAGKHDLAGLCLDADFSIGEGDEALLARLSQSVLWHGIYHVASGVSASPDASASNMADIDQFIGKLKGHYDICSGLASG